MRRNEFLTNRFVILFVMLLALAVSAGGWIAVARRGASNPESPRASVSSSPAPQGGKGQEKKSALEVEVVRVTQRGFAPDDFKQKTGTFLLVVQNESGRPLPAINLHTPRTLAEKAAPLKEFRPATGSVFHEEFLDLPSGDYILTLPDDRLKKCVITIKDKDKS